MLLNVSDQAEVNALVVHCNTSWSIGFEDASVDSKDRRAVARSSMMLGGSGSVGNLVIPRGSHLCFV